MCLVNDEMLWVAAANMVHVYDYEVSVVCRYQLYVYECYGCRFPALWSYLTSSVVSVYVRLS